VSRDHWMSHAPMTSFRLCLQCPMPPSASACYRVQCAKHNK
jgi:hypothetical protein